jgi:hypothetical protein
MVKKIDHRLGALSSIARSDYKTFRQFNSFIFFPHFHFDVIDVYVGVVLMLRNEIKDKDQCEIWWFYSTLHWQICTIYLQMKKK